MNAVTTTQTIDHAVGELLKGAQTLAGSSIEQRIEAAKACIQGVARIAQRWQTAGCQANRTSGSVAGRAEEILTGPVASLRYLHLIIKTMQDLQSKGKPQLPGTAKLVEGQLRVPVFPTQLLFDSVAFRGMRGETWLEPGVSAQNMFGDAPDRMLRRKSVQPRVELVLGAGNVSSIAMTDSLTKIFQDDSAVLLKMNPVNQYLGPLFEEALQPLVKLGWLRIVYGAAVEGAYAISHPHVHGVHITGSTDTHEAIVWGCDAAQRQQRKAAGTPLLDKPISSELGNVTPWIIVPGDYTKKQLAAQAETMAASITNNASFNCVATKMVITWKQWTQREQFLGLLNAAIARTENRYAYYPGAEERFAQFSGGASVAPDANGVLPWKLRSNLNYDEHALLFQRESFVCVAGETMLEGSSPTDYLSRTVEFVNERMTGTLAVELTVPTEFQKRSAAEFDTALRRLRYGTIGINQWAGLSFAWMSPPWGGYPGASLADVQSGIGSVHNTYLLDRPQKSIVFAPLCMSPKPVWFSTHRCPETVAQRLLSLCVSPSILKLPALFAAALRG
ncbi:MAG TPA: NAD-dependent aldehyde dehydrogenase [Planctomycetaceae bacterium]|nr:NAD-dependent aldehyde dehydrogenase [Planctomycetaceae bacterium]